MATFDTNHHSAFLLSYCLLLFTDKREKVINKDISEYAKSTFEKIGCNYNIELTKWKFEKDYILINFKAHPNSSLSKFINAYKSSSSRVIKNKFIGHSNQSFWEKGYYLMTEESLTITMIDAFIKNGKI